MSSVRQKRAEVHKAEAREAERLRVQGGDISEKIEKLVEEVEATPILEEKVEAKAPVKKKAKKKAAPKAKAAKKSTQEDRMNPIKRQTSFPQPKVSDSKVSIKDQGTVNFAKTEDVATPGDPKPYGAGEMRGGGAALRGKKFSGIFQQMFRAGGVSPQNNALDSLRQQRARLQEQMKTIPVGIRGGTNEFGQMPRPAINSFGPKYNPTQQEIDDLARYKSILSQQKEIDSQISSMMPNRGGLGVQLDSPLILEPPRRPGGMENLSGSLGGQRPSPYSAPQMPQMGGGYGGGQGMQQFMQFMQTMMQMFQQLQGGGMGGGFQGQMRRPQTYGRSPYGGY